MEYEVYTNKSYINWNVKGDERILQNENQNKLDGGLNL